ncbi:MAG: alpha/beta hydrolase, partial [Candidatus Binatia bacterium]
MRKGVDMSESKTVDIRLDVPYGGGAAGNLCGDLYLPTGAGAHPALLCLHGGAWLRGSQRQYKSWGPWLAERGYAVVAVDYRLSSQASPAWPGVWQDVCRA